MDNSNEYYKYTDIHSGWKQQQRYNVLPVIASATIINRVNVNFLVVSMSQVYYVLYSIG